jgi:hypothetical protein
MKIKLQIKNSFGSVLFEFEKENNTVKDTLLEAVKSGANLRSADLSGANLSGAYLRSADLSGANLRSADLSGADLRSADLSGANLRSADLSGANLSGAYLSGAYLRSADLRSADLSGANLRSADLSGANLSGANLRSAYLRSADLSGANLSGAYLRSADLSGAKEADLPIAQTRILPEGDLIVYKKAYYRNSEGSRQKAILKLLIPKEAKRSSAFGRKCRAEYAHVLELPEGITECYSDHDNSFKYHKGDIVRPVKPFSENWQEECASGIHFFITRIEAENY